MKADSTRNVLVTGGSGYIGSHVARQLVDAGHQVTVLDNLSTGFRDLLVRGETLVEGDIADESLIKELIRKYQISHVMHFAAAAVVPESVADPVKYYRNNVSGSLNLINTCATNGVKGFVFSSTGSVYGESAPAPTPETELPVPSNPYSRSKLFTEWMLRDISLASGMKYAILRYFNVAGADPEGRQGQKSKNATHLIKIASEVALKKRHSLKVYGKDYDTPDGTGVRDYIHVEDLATAHLAALAYIDRGGSSEIFNCGYGHGFSVLEVIKAVESVTGEKLNVEMAERRAGDISTSIADNSKIKNLLGWTPRFDNLETIVQHAIAWEAKL